MIHNISLYTFLQSFIQNTVALFQIFVTFAFESFIHCMFINIFLSICNQISIENKYKNSMRAHIAAEVGIYIVCTVNMTEELSGVTIVIFIAAGVLTILLLFIFAKRQIMRFALRSRRGPHIPIGHDTRKSLKKEIERRIEVIPRIQYEPQLISDPRLIMAPRGQVLPHYYRLKAVDDVKALEAEISKYDSCLKRHPSENLRAYLLATLATPLNGSGQRLIHQFCDLYEHARHDPTEFGDEEYQVYSRLFLKLLDAARLLKSYSSSRKSSPSRTPIKKNIETKRNILEPRMKLPEDQTLTGSRPNTLTVTTLDNSETSV